MGFTLWGKLEFNQRDGFLDCPHGDRVCGGGVKNETRCDSSWPFVGADDSVRPQNSLISRGRS